MNMKAVLDTSAILYLSDFSIFEEIFTVSEVLEEAKDRMSNLKISGLRIRVEEPSENSLGEVKKVAGETGDLEELSKTDLKLLALAKEKKCLLISDDRAVQNVAKKMGINFISLFSKKISKFILWGKYCKNCKKWFEGRFCPICGEVLRRRPRRIEEIQ